MNKISLAALIILLSLLTGCITIIEKYTIYKNGSGTLEYTIDMSEMYEMMSAFSDSTDETAKPEIDQSMQEAFPGLQILNGISNVELTGDISKYIAGIKFSFKDAKALNQALALIFKGEGSVTSEMEYVEINKKTFTRYSLTSDEFNKEKILGSQDLDPETMKSVLESMKYKIIVNFEKPVKKVTTQAPFEMEGSTVSIETNFSDIFNNADLLQTIIKTK